MSTIFWVVGDPSADLHCANVIRELRQLAPEVKHVGLGGQNMEKEGFVLLYDLCTNAIMGFVEVVKHLGDIRQLMKNTLNWIKEHNPTGVVLVDYPGFNLHIAPMIKELNIPIIYYISPQVWAWKKNRVKKIARWVRKVLVIFPFEVPIYEQEGVECVYVGHPLLDKIPTMRKELDYTPPYTIGLLPGSRPQEIKRNFPVMLETAKQFLSVYPQTKFVVPAFNRSCVELIRDISGDFAIEIYEGGIEQVLQISHAGIVSSGTATLESALSGMPFVLIYRTHPLTYYIARLLVNISHIGIVNILMGREVVPELIQNDATPLHIYNRLVSLVQNSTLRGSMIYDFKQLREKLGSPGAGKQTAFEILRTLGISPSK
ncbi:MAG: lipid-A-disaccharide synthase [Candidatus Hydrogenedens sp.]